MIAQALPEFETQRLRIRTLRAGDAERMFAYRGDANAMEYQLWVPSTLDDVLAFIAENGRGERLVSGSWHQAGIALKESDELIGDVGVRPAFDERQVEFGMTLHPGFQHQGYAVEAGTALLDLLVALGEHRVFGSIDPRNLPSVQFATRLGLRKEAHLVKSFWFKGDWVDDAIYAVLADEWKASGPRSGCSSS